GVVHLLPRSYSTLLPHPHCNEGLPVQNHHPLRGYPSRLPAATAAGPRLEFAHGIVFGRALPDQDGERMTASCADKSPRANCPRGSRNYPDRPHLRPSPPPPAARVPGLSQEL